MNIDPSKAKEFGEKQQAIVDKIDPAANVEDLTDEEKMAIFVCAGVPIIVEGHPDTPDKVIMKISPEVRVGLAKVDYQFRVYVQKIGELGKDEDSKVRLKKRY
jgi:hypothetical protein